MGGCPPSSSFSPPSISLSLSLAALLPGGASTDETQRCYTLIDLRTATGIDPDRLSYHGAATWPA